MRNDEQHRDAESGELVAGDAELERMMDDGRRGERHAATSPGMG